MKPLHWMAALTFLTLIVVPTSGQIPWRSGSEALPAIDPARRGDLGALLDRVRNRHAVIQFAKVLTESERSALAAQGCHLLSSVADGAYIARIDAGLPAAALARWNVRSVAPMQRRWKLHPDLAAQTPPVWSILAPAKPDAAAAAAAADPTIAVIVLFHADVPLAPTARHACQRLGGAVRSHIESINGLVVELPLSAVGPLADSDAVLWIEPPLPALTEVNDDNRLRTGAGIVQAAPYGLDGSGVTVLVFDGGEALASHGDFGGRLTVRDNSGLSDHATHVAGTVGGSGAGSGGQYRGMAPGVTIESYGFEQPGGLSQGFLYTDPGDLEDDYDDAINVYGVDLSNNSIGTNTAPNGFPCSWEGDYGATGALIDAIVGGSLGIPFRVVWANGNERQGAASCGATYHTTAPPACAKNHITVGALNSDDDSVTSFTSWGPCDDGRIKPDLAGPGCQISADGSVTSTSSAGGYTTKCGTSMAAPTVTGLAALLMQDYRLQYPGAPDFLNSTLKVLLAQTAADVQNTGPDYQTGYGSVRIEPAIQLMRSGNFLEDAVGQGETYSVLVLVGAGDTQVKVTLAWDDVPGTPNVDPALVNDLDLRVIGPSGTTYFPWTLDPAAPSLPAVRTVADHVNNIEQVVVDAPVPGAYRVEIVGFAVPMGPQTFSLTATPQLVPCSSAGVASFDQARFGCASAATVRVVDCDLNTDDGVTETIMVTVVSDSDALGEVIVLTETAPETAAFEGNVAFDAAAAPGIVGVLEGDTVTVTYIDSDDGQGGTQVTVTGNAVIDCSPPIIAGVQVQTLEARRAVIAFTTDEPAAPTVHLGPDCNTLSTTVSPAGLGTTHAVAVPGLDDNTTYYYAVEATDAVGHTAADDNGGACYTFTTPEVPDFFTEEFSGDNDLENVTLTFTPNGSGDFYATCAESITELPVAASGAALPLGDDDSEAVTLSGGSVLLYGQAYSTIFVGSNGFITLDGGDSDYTESLADHFSQPRISALFDDLNPAAGGSVLAQELADRVVVTWLDVPEYSTSNMNTFQVELLFNGDIHVSYLNRAATDGIGGLSAGVGVDPDFLEFDLSAAGNCGPRPPVAGNVQRATPVDTAIEIALPASDDGLPDPPALFTRRILSLPLGQLVDTATATVISAPSLPYVFATGDDTVTYTPPPGFQGQDSFTFGANDGGVPPDGGDSNIAVVAISVAEVLGLPFFDDFPTTTFDPEKWETVADVVIDGTALGEPSAPNAARLNGNPDGGDEMATVELDLSAASAVRLQYQWQRTGGGESPDAGDDLFSEFRTAGGTWQTLVQHLGSGADMTTFQQESLLLPAAALHPAFRLRFRNVATAGLFDDWFVDDVSLAIADAPSAGNVAVATPQFTPVDVVLSASDPNGDPLSYTVLALPANGLLTDPGSGVITAVPHVLAANGDTVHYAPMPVDFQGIDGFTYQADDGAHVSNTATVEVTVGGPQPVYRFLVDDTDPGWSRTGQWAFGMPTGGGSNGGDPTSGFTGNNVLGYNLTGNYADNLGLQYLTTGALDCSMLAAVELRFQRWLGIESSSFDHATVELSTNGSTWSVIWNHASGSFNDAAWVPQAFDISALADGEPTVFIRWSMGPTDGSVTYPGWNLDDIEIWGIVPTAQNCYGDTDGDGAVDLDDILCVLDAFGGSACGGADVHPCSADGAVDLDDLLALIDAFRGVQRCSVVCP